jgi:hypothetical protein
MCNGFAIEEIALCAVPAAGGAARCVIMAPNPSHDELMRSSYGDAKRT